MRNNNQNQLFNIKLKSFQDLENATLSQIEQDQIIKLQKRELEYLGAAIKQDFKNNSIMERLFNIQHETLKQNEF